MIKANRETKISHISTKIIEGWIDQWMPKNKAKPIKKARKKHKNDEKHPKISGDSRRWYSLSLTSSTQSPPQRNTSDMADIISSYW